MDHFHKLELETRRHQRGTTYSRTLLIRYTYDYARSEESRDVFLQAFFRSMRLSLDADDGSQEDNRLGLTWFALLLARRGVHLEPSVCILDLRV